MIQPDRIAWAANSNNAPVTNRRVIIHATRSGTSMNPTEFEGTLNYFSRPSTEASSHWVISRTGIAARCVPDNRQSWHAGYLNDTHFGVEIEQGVESDGFTEPQIARLVDVCKGYVTDYGVPPVHALSETRDGFIGHQETAQGKSWGKSDPGRLFPWSDFIQRLTAVPAPPPPPPPYVATEGLEAVAGPLQAINVYSKLPWYPGLRLRDEMDANNQRRARDFAAWIARELS